jgi:hypothetical protein
MEKDIHSNNTEPGFWIRPGVKFEDYFSKKTVSPEKIAFARRYIEDKMGYGLNEDSLIDFSAIGIKLFGSMIVDIVLEYENFNGKRLDG